MLAVAAGSRFLCDSETLETLPETNGCSGRTRVFTGATGLRMDQGKLLSCIFICTQEVLELSEINFDMVVLG